MSSHHIVRDEQEPALLILEPNVVSFDLLMSLMEWSPTVLVPETHLDEVLSWGIKIDLVICSLNNKEAVEAKVMEQAPVQVLAFHQPDYLADAFNYLLAKKYYALNVIGNLPNTTEEPQFGNLLKVVYYYQESKVYWMAQGKYEKWMEKGQKLSVFGPQNLVLEIVGLSGDAKELSVEQDQVVSINGRLGFWIREYL